MKKIMLIASRGAGKDTAAEYLTKKYDFKQFALADRIRLTCEALGLPITKTNLIKIGEKVKEICYQNKWIELLDSDIEKYKISFDKFIEGYEMEDEFRIVISDVRRDYEYKHYLEQGYMPVKIIADFDTCVRRVVERDGAIDMDAFGHSTELEHHKLEGLTINNNGTLEELYYRLDKLMTILDDKILVDKYMKQFKG